MFAKVFKNQKEAIELSNREMQSFGATCIIAYCKRLTIQHPSIDGLVNHLFAILTAPDLPTWDQQGSELKLCGRGEVVPSEIEEIFPSEQIAGFTELIEHVVEIGIADMYGADTSLPREHLENAVKILLEHDVSVPNLSLCKIQSRPLKDRWGTPLSEAEFADYLRVVLA